MRTTINIEFTDDEIRTHIEDLGRRWLFSVLGQIGNYIGQLDPQVLIGVQQGMNETMARLFRDQARRPQHPHGHAGPPGMPPQGGPVGPPPGMPYGPFGPPGMPYGPFGPPPGMPYGVPVPQGPYGNVRPIREPAALERCFPIEGTRHAEPGWGCHLCATYNGLQRPTCRHCGHPRCDAPVAPPQGPIVTPPPGGAPPGAPPMPPQPEPAT